MRESEKGPECLSDTMKNSFDLRLTGRHFGLHLDKAEFIAKGIKDS